MKYYKNIIYMYYYWLLFLIIFIIIILYISKYNENFKCKEKKINNECDFRFYYYPSFCSSYSLNPKKKCIKCPYKRVGLTINDNPKCCRNICYKYKKKNKGIPYYCERYNNCIKKYAKSVNDMNCGKYMLYGNSAKIFKNMNECKNYVYKFNNLNKEKCLKTNGAGWCTDFKGDGICVRGTPEGPLDQVRYNMCLPNQRNKKNAWIYYDMNNINYK
jgi:hypothetical protein